MEIMGHRPSTGLAIGIAGFGSVAAATTMVGRVRTRNEFLIAGGGALAAMTLSYEGAKSLDDNAGFAARPLGLALGAGATFAAVKGVRALEASGRVSPRIAGVMAGAAFAPVIGSVLSAITHHSSD